MSTAGKNLKPWTKEGERTWIPLLFSVPVFILVGFLHSVADAFYIFGCGLDWIKENFQEIWWRWLLVVLGNFVGCNLGKIL